MKISYLLLISQQINVMKTFTNMVRMYPYEYARHFEISLACEAENSYPLYSYLDTSAQIQADIINDPNCPIQHNTCYKYCSSYNSCSYEDRILHYYPNLTNINENLIYGRKNPIKALKLLLNSQGHCNNIFRKDINVIGIGFNNNIFIQDFGYLQIYPNNTIIDCAYYNDCYYCNYIGNKKLLVNINGKNNTMTNFLGKNSYYFCTYEKGNYYFILV
jgi:hypothetical protein